MPCLAVGCRALLGLVLAIAVVGKLRGRAEFARSVRQMNVLPPFLARPVAAAVVVGELGTVLALAVPTRESGLIGFCLAGALLSAFTVGIAVSLAGGNREPCRCFGSSDTPLGARHVGRNLVLVAVAMVGCLGSLSASPADPAIAAMAAVGGATAGGLVVALDDLVALFAPVPPAKTNA